MGTVLHFLLMRGWKIGLLFWETGCRRLKTRLVKPRVDTEELQREGRCVLKSKLGWTAAPFTQICGAGHHWVSIGFWPKHRTAYLYDPLDTFRRP
jgi:hypothetical protein